MEDEAVFSIMAKCFAPVSEAEWRDITKGAMWSDFLNGARRAIQDEKTFGRSSSVIERLGMRCPLQEFVFAGEVRALFAPPTYAEKQQFAAEHLVGGLPGSAVPVESLYTEWSNNQASEAPFSQKTSMYRGDSALYMEELVKRLGLQLPESYVGCADHLALELDLVAVLLRSNMQEEACQFLSERFAWLTAYRLHLLKLGDDATFYRGLVDILLGIQAQQGLTRVGA